VETGGRSSLAEGLRTRDFPEPFLEPASSRSGTVVGLDLRFALNATPFGLRRAALRSRPTTGSRPPHNQESRTIDKNNRRKNHAKHQKGTLLMGLA
jgi:hypothetical protein